ncbi:MAG TPA: NUDIX hydrolase [Planctomycetes bacterium]|nr:NUDIX hydrolase [Planctomycetota bacterium]
MTLQPWEKLGDETLARHLVFHVRRSRQRSPRTGVEIPFFLIDTANWVNILPITTDGEIVFVRQWRQGSERISLELPGGLIDPGEHDPLQAARRELREETGHEGKDWVALGSCNPNPAIMSNRCHTYLATGCRPVGDLQQDLGEDLEVVKVPEAELDQLLRDGGVDHAIVLATIALWRAHTAE